MSFVVLNGSSNCLWNLQEMCSLWSEAILVCCVGHRVRNAVWCHVGKASCHHFTVIVWSQVLQLARLLCLGAVTSFKAA